MFSKIGLFLETVEGANAATGAGDAAATGMNVGSILTMIVPFAIIIAVFYFMLIRPENKRKKSMQKMLSELVVGDEITTRGGVVGKITKIKDDKLWIQSGGVDGTTFQVMRWAVSTKGASTEEAQ